MYILQQGVVTIVRKQIFLFGLQVKLDDIQYQDEFDLTKI